MKAIRLESYIDRNQSIVVEGQFVSELTPQTEIQWYSQSGNITNMPKLSKTSLSQKIIEIMIADSKGYSGIDYQIKCIEGDVK